MLCTSFLSIKILSMTIMSFYYLCCNELFCWVMWMLDAGKHSSPSMIFLEKTGTNPSEAYQISAKSILWGNKFFWYKVWMINDALNSYPSPIFLNKVWVTIRCELPLKKQHVFILLLLSTDILLSKCIITSCVGWWE
jgi:hypothetical protein